MYHHDLAAAVYPISVVRFSSAAALCVESNHSAPACRPVVKLRALWCYVRSSLTTEHQSTRAPENSYDRLFQPARHNFSGKKDCRAALPASPCCGVCTVRLLCYDADRGEAILFLLARAAGHCHPGEPWCSSVLCCSRVPPGWVFWDLR